MIASALPSMSPSPFPSCGGVLVTTDGKPLPLTAATVRADARAGLARVVLEQTFTNPYTEPLRVTYRMPLPADGAVSGYRFTAGERVIDGEVDRKDRARERFEQAIVEGHTAALLDEERSSVFTQEIGNLPPGATLVVSLVIDQPLAWVAEGAGGWEWRFPTVVAPRYLGAQRREAILGAQRREAILGAQRREAILGAPAGVPDAARVVVETTEDPLPIQLALELVIRDPLADARPDSPSHALAIASAPEGTKVGLAGASALDRDLVVRWSVAQPDVGAVIDTARPAQSHARAGDAFGLLTLVPPAATTRTPKLARDLVVLLDTSGSMGGVPLDQARRLVGALVNRMDEHDRLEMIEFSMQPRRWTKHAVPADAGNRAKAHAWLASLQANGGTEMRTGILEALGTLRAEAQRQVVLITDGLIGFESEVVAEIHRRLPAGSRVHTVGVGSAVNRSLTLPAARAGRGSETIIGLDEDPERAIARILDRTGAPTVVDLVLSGDALVEHAPQHLPDLMGGAPARVALRLAAKGGTLRVEGRTAIGLWSRTITVPAVELGHGSAAVVALFGREKVEDLEMIRAAGEGTRVIEHEITALGLDFQISTRHTSWVAIDRERSVDPRTPTRHETMPQALPYGTSVAGFGLRSSAAPPPRQRTAMTMTAPMPAAPMAAPMGAFEGGGAKKAKGERVERFSGPAGQATRTRGRASDDAFFEEKPADESFDLDDAREAESSAATGVRVRLFDAVRELGGRLLALADGTLVVEIDVPEDGIDWHVPADVELELADGSRVNANVDATRTTLAGTHAAGARLRLVLPNATNLGIVRAIHLDGPDPLVIRV